MSTTGLSSLLLRQSELQVQAKTVHLAFGLDDGRYSKEEVVDRLKSDPQFIARRQELENMDALFLDEVSMLSKKMFDTIEFVCRAVRQNDTVMGGVQAIFSGKSGCLVVTEIK